MGEVTSESSESRSDRWFAIAGDVLLAALPAVLTVHIALRDGGFFPGTAALAATEVALCIAVVLVVARRPWSGLSIPLIAAAVAVGGLAAWTLASSDWSGSQVRATVEYTRVLLYALTLILFGLLPFSLRRVRWMLYGFAAAAVTVCVVALIARTLPEVIWDPTLASEDRLGYPLGYWNGLALMAGLGIIFCGHLACSVRDPWFMRVLGAAAIPVLTAALYYTLSRGGTWASIGGVVVYVLLARPRALLSGAVATVPPVAVMLFTLNPPNALTDPQWAAPEVIAAGHDAALAIALAVGAAAVLRVVMLPFDVAVKRFRLPDRVRRPAMVGATVAFCALVLAGAAAFDVPDVVSAKYAEFNAEDDDTVVSGGGSRLLSAQSNGRQDHWDVAMAAYRRDPLHGSGAGMYSVDWARERPGTVSVQDAHSFYVELLGELGWPGLAMAAVALLLIVGGFAFRIRGPDRALFAALLAAGLAWAAHASVDWIWEMPALTLWLFAFGGAALARSARSEERLPHWTIGLRVAAVALCVAIVVLPGRVAVSQARIDTGLDALEEADCDRARTEARRALSAYGERALPYYMIGYCHLEQGRPRRAVRAMSEAVERDPQRWTLHFGLAVAQGRAGLDPRPEVRRAWDLNPGDGRTNRLAEELRGSTKRAWRRAARPVPLTAPGPPIL